MTLSYEAAKQVQIALALHERYVQTLGAEQAKVQLAIGFTWLAGHYVTEAPQAADLLNKVGGSVFYGCGNGQRNYVEIKNDVFVTEVR